MLRAILNKSWRQHPTRRNRHAGHCWRSRDKLISDVLLWTPTYGRQKQDDQPCDDTGCSPEDLPEAMIDREKWRERVRDICASGISDDDDDDDEIYRGVKYGVLKFNSAFRRTVTD